MNHYPEPNIPSRQILVPRASQVRPPPTSSGHSLKILFAHFGEVLIWVPGTPQSDVLDRSRNDVQETCQSDVKGTSLED